MRISDWSSDVCSSDLARLYADGCAAEFLGAFHTQLFADHNALAVVVVDASAHEAQRGVTRHRGRGVAGKDVDFSRLQGGEALLCGNRSGLEFGGLAKIGRASCRERVWQYV